VKLPAAALAASFAGGIMLGSQHFFLSRFGAASGLFILFLITLCALLTGLALTWKNALRWAGLLALFSWVLIGTVAASVSHQPLPERHLLSLLESKRLELSSPLRWHGRLREEPRRLAWGYGMDVDLKQVEFQGAQIPLTGGLRLTFAAENRDGPQLPALHAGDEVTVVARARLPSIFRDDGAFDRRSYLAEQGIHAIASLRAAELLERGPPAPPSARYLLARFRGHLRDTLDTLFPASPEKAAILRAMLLGDRSFVDRDASRNFQLTGTYHILVVAGLHVTAIAVFLFWGGRLLRLPRVLASLAILAALAAYVGIVEQRPPVIRAALMAGVVVLGRLLFRRLDLLNSAALAALLILFFRPLALFDPSFQLSFLAMACIGGIAAPWLERTAEPYVRALRGWRDVTRDLSHEPRQAQYRIDLRAAASWLAVRFSPEKTRMAENAAVGLLSFSFRVWEIFVLSFVLQIGMLPMMAQQFHRVTLAGPFSNLFAVPLTAIIVPLGFLTLGAALVLRPIAVFLAHPLAWLTALLLRVVSWFAHFPRWSYRIPGPPLALVILFLALLVVLAAAIRLRSRWAPLAAAALLACAVVISVHPFAPRTVPGKLELTALDVGQGDSLLLVSPQGKTMLIDSGGAFSGFRPGETHAGPDPGEDAVSPYLWSRGFQRLDIVALTHAHHDHIGGLTAILENFRVGRLWIGREVSSLSQAALEALARSRHIPIEHERRGQTTDWDSVHLKVLWPDIVPEETAAPPKNNDSLVLRLTYGKRIFLLAGDAEKQAEREIAAESPGDALRADVLKVGHHGSKNSTMEEFLGRIKPKVALISAGEENPYGHPSREVLERLERAGVRVLRTDRDGAIHVLTDGEDLEISCFTPCPQAAPESPSRQAESPDQHQQPQNK
jgi:competence protein ComEC